MSTPQRIRLFLTIMVPVVAFVLGLTAGTWMIDQYSWNRNRASAVLEKVDPICAQTSEAARMSLVAREPDRDQPWIAVICAAYDAGRRAR
jgi:hypothetical protein